jgi:SHS2 domain-containing protein
VVVGGRVLTRPRYEVIDHTADAAIIAYGDTVAELFENAGYALFDLVFDLSEVPGSASRPIVAAGDTIEDLLVGWLSSLLAEAEIAGLAFSTFSIDRLEEGGVQGWAAGMPVSALELIGPPVKAVTYHDLAVVEVPEGWWARVVFDV